MTTVTMAVLGRRAEDIDEFIEKLEATGAFENVVPVQQDRNEEGLRRVTIEAIYSATAEDAAPEAAVEGAVKPPQAPAPAKPSGTASKQGVRP
jgi:hypothetical protein